jgi:hypothetical protein
LAGAIQISQCDTENEFSISSPNRWEIRKGQLMLRNIS